MKNISVFLIYNKLLEQFLPQTLYNFYDLKNLENKDVSLDLKIIQLNGNEVDLNLYQKSKSFFEKSIKIPNDIEIINLNAQCFADVLNLIFEKSKEYFIFLETGDFIFKNWIDVFVNYIKKEEVDVVLPLILLRQKEFLITVNDMPFIDGYYYDFGFFDYDIVIKKPSFILNGAIFKKESILNFVKDNKPFKEEFGILTANELFFRMLFDKKRARSLPFFGIEHNLPEKYENFNNLTTKINSSVFELTEEKGGIKPEDYNLLIDKIKLSIINNND